MLFCHLNCSACTTGASPLALPLECGQNERQSQAITCHTKMRPFNPLAGALSVLSLSLSLCLASIPAAIGSTAYITLEEEDAIAKVSIPEGKLLKRFPAGKRPRGIGSDPSGQKLYVAVSDDNTIKQFDPEKGKEIAKLPSGKDPETFLIEPKGKLLFASNENDNAVTVVDLQNRKTVKSIPVGLEPEGLCASPNGRWVVSTSETTNMAHWIDPQSLTVIDNTLVDPRPRACSFSKDSDELWISSEIAGTVSVIDVATRTAKQRISFQIPGVTREKIQPVGILIDRSRAFAYVALGPSNRVAVIDARSYKVIDYLLVGQRVWNLSFDPDEAYLVTANGLSNDITLVDLKTRKVQKSIAVGQGPWGITLLP